MQRQRRGQAITDNHQVSNVHFASVSEEWRWINNVSTHVHAVFGPSHVFMHATWMLRGEFVNAKTAKCSIEQLSLFTTCNLHMIRTVMGWTQHCSRGEPDAFATSRWCDVRNQRHQAHSCTSSCRQVHAFRRYP